MRMTFNDIDTILIMGHTCVGKTTVSRELSKKNGASVYGVDDLKIFLQMIGSAGSEVLNPTLVNALVAFTDSGKRKTLETLVRENMALSQMFSYGLEHIIHKNLVLNDKLIVEGQHILPSLQAKKTIMSKSIEKKIIRSVVIVENEDEYIMPSIINRHREKMRNHNLEINSKETTMLAMIVRERDYLIAEAKKYNINIVESRPLSTLTQRVEYALLDVS